MTNDLFMKTYLSYIFCVMNLIWDRINWSVYCMAFELYAGYSRLKAAQ